jgi:hypothetical protein
MLAKGGNHPTEMAGSVLRALEGSLRAFERHRQLILGLRQDALVRLTLSDHSAPSHPGGADDRVSNTDANRHDDISHNGSSGFGDSADSASQDLLASSRHRSMHLLARPGAAAIQKVRLGP